MPAAVPAAALAPPLPARTGRLRDLDLDLAAVELRAIQAPHGLTGLLRGRHLDEPEASRPTRVAIGHHAGGIDPADCGKRLTKTLTGRGKRESSDKKLDGHDALLLRLPFSARPEPGRGSRRGLRLRKVRGEPTVRQAHLVYTSQAPPAKGISGPRLHGVTRCGQCGFRSDPPGSGSLRSPPGSSPPGSLTTARPGANLGALSNVGMDAARRTCRSFFPWVRAEAGGDGDEGGAAIITGSDRGRERACSGRSGIRWR